MRALCNRSAALALAAVLLHLVALRPASAAEPRKVAILVWDGVELLDFAGPGEVFAAASSLAVEGPAFEVFTVGLTGDPITSQNFLEVVPDYSFEQSPRPDVLVVPGGRTGALQQNAALLAWVRASAGDADAVMSVCTGAMVLAKAGLLDGKEATTWYGAIDSLRSGFPEVIVRPGTRFVDNGAIITTAGVSAGIDGALHVVARLHGRRVAERTAQYMEYAWTPDSRYAPAYSLLDPSSTPTGRSAELAHLLDAAGDRDGAVSLLRRALADDPRQPLLWSELAGLLHQAGDLAGALEAYRRVDGRADLRQRALYNTACIRAGRGEIDGSLDALAGAVEAGYRNVGWIEQDPDLAPLRQHPRFVALVDSLR